MFFLAKQSFCKEFFYKDGMKMLKQLQIPNAFQADCPYEENLKIQQQQNEWPAHLNYDEIKQVSRREPA